ncbi:protein cramped-like isoform X2 [Anthonomus grandis grandis]|uniref:protein cramped-like isoform X2 n=1 Tax=Anthonomus grandis grandis TaxID=2921223 RepID=UPI0021654DDE|nr:protein cramped-like isoform X2 [Anthonomus grandis grandis]
MEVDEPGEDIAKKNQDSGASGAAVEPVLGSITTALDKEEKPMQIRSSARVSKKMKLEQEQDKKHEDQPECNQLLSPSSESSMPHLPIPGDSDTKGHSAVGGQPVRCSTRVVKKPVKQEVPPSEPKLKKEEPKTDIKKETRKWTSEDKMMFFEAVNEYGKDFENIQQHINNKLKKKGASDEQMRTKEHVRQFYIRAFHEVSKLVKFSDSVKKVVQELYGIINYGELYKKLDYRVSEKVYHKLNELIYRGETCVRLKGKNIKIKTPMCKALIKLNQLDEKYEDIKLPNRVTVELRPKDMDSFVKIQCMAQNPRLKTTLPIQKRLTSLIQCLNKRWKTIDAQIYENAAISKNPATQDCAPSDQEVQEKLSLVAPPLRLRPPPEAKIELPSINFSEYLTRQSICLTAYESRLGLDTFSEIKIKSKKRKRKLDDDRISHVKEVNPGEKPAEPWDLKVETVKVEDPDVKYSDNEPEAFLANAVHDAVNTILSLQTIDRQQSEASESEENTPSKPVKTESLFTDGIKPDNRTSIPVISQEDLDRIETIKKGWTEETSESLTIGEMYMMFGCDSKLILEYSWDTDKDLEKPKKTTGNFLEMWNESFEVSWEMKQKNLTASLSKLLSLAKLHYSPNSVKCSCGHICNDKGLKSSGIGSKLKRNSGMESSGSNATKMDEVASNSERKSVLFRRPGLPVMDSPSMQQQLNSIKKLQPRYTSRKGRPKQKPIVVERKLPLLPNNLSGHQIVRMSIISQGPKVDDAENDNLEAEEVEEEQQLNLEKVIRDPEEENSIISTK